MARTVGKTFPKAAKPKGEPKPKDDKKPEGKAE